MASSDETSTYGCTKCDWEGTGLTALWDHLEDNHVETIRTQRTYVANVLGRNMLPSSTKCHRCGAKAPRLTSDVDGSVAYVCPTHGSITGLWGGGPMVAFNPAAMIGSQGVRIQYGDADGICITVGAVDEDDACAKIERTFRKKITIDDIGESA